LKLKFFLNIFFCFENFYFLEAIQTQGIRFRLYTNERFKREKLFAESTVMFGLVNLDEDMCKIIPLERAFVNIYILINFYLLLPFLFSHLMIQV